MGRPKGSKNRFPRSGHAIVKKSRYVPEISAEERRTRRADLRSKYERIYNEAMERIVIHQDAQGNYNENKSPDFQAAVRAVQGLAKLDALEAPEKGPEEIPKHASKSLGDQSLYFFGDGASPFAEAVKARVLETMDQGERNEMEGGEEEGEPADHESDNLEG